MRARRWGEVVRRSLDGSGARRTAQRLTGAIAGDEMKGLRRIVRRRTWLSHGASPGLVRVTRGCGIAATRRKVTVYGCKSKWHRDLRHVATASRRECTNRRRPPHVPRTTSLLLPPRRRHPLNARGVASVVRGVDIVVPLGDNPLARPHLSDRTAHPKPAEPAIPTREGAARLERLNVASGVRETRHLR